MSLGRWWCSWHGAEFTAFRVNLGFRKLHRESFLKSEITGYVCTSVKIKVRRPVLVPLNVLTLIF